jgi:hypothetical protein
MREIIFAGRGAHVDPADAKYIRVAGSALSASQIVSFILDSSNEQLLAGGLTPEQMAKYGEGSKRNEFDEVQIWGPILLPDELADNELRAQELVQFAQDRSGLSGFAITCVNQGRAAARLFGLNTN